MTTNDLRHLILLDSWLETRDAGWEILQQLTIHPATRTIPLILWTGDQERVAAHADLLHWQQIPVLSQPFELDDFYITLHHVLEVGRTSQQKQPA